MLLCMPPAKQTREILSWELHKRGSALTLSCNVEVFDAGGVRVGQVVQAVKEELKQAQQRAKEFAPEIEVEVL